MTKFCHGMKISELENNLGFHYTKDRSQLALKAASDCISQVDFEMQGTRST